MSHHNQEHTGGVGSTYITIEHAEHDNIQESTTIGSYKKSSNANEQSAESSVSPSNKNDTNANTATQQPETSSSCPVPLNSDVLTVRLACLEEEQQRHHSSANIGDRDRHYRHNRHNENELVPILEYQTEYPITRFSRKWKRPEVQGFCCLAIEVTCLATLAVLGLQAVGYFGTTDKENEHLPLTFSWKILWEFFGNTALPKKLMSCLFANLGGKLVLHEEEHFAGLEPMGPMDVNYVLLDAFSSSTTNDDYKPRTMQTKSIAIMSSHRNFCEFRQGQYSLGWLVKFFMVTNFMSVLNVITSSILYASVSVRRRKGMQVMLLLPSFFCFFVSIFQQIPISFQYNYFDQTLSKQMQDSLVQSTPPFYVVPILDETQLHHQCCGTDFPGRWENFGANVYPPSCCNTTAHDCAKLDVIRREHVWTVGCFQVEHDKVHSFERWALFLYALKVIAEVGIFCTLSDLTRIDYPAPEVTETSRCDFRDYQVKCRGVMHIKGVTKDGRIVVESKYFLPWRLVPSRTDMLNGVQLNMKTDQNQLKGSVEVVKRNNVANFLNEDIQIDLSRKNRGIFVFTLS